MAAKNPEWVVYRKRLTQAVAEPEVMYYAGPATIGGHRWESSPTAPAVVKFGYREATSKLTDFRGHAYAFGDRDVYFNIIKLSDLAAGQEAK